MSFLDSKKLVPNHFDEINWSGRGQHAEYTKEEECEIPLQVENVLGSSSTALVQSVICKRIRLARKTIQCGRRLKREDAIKEVELLQRLSHSHLIQAVGTYIIGRSLSILLYPATTFNLETFMDSTDVAGTMEYSTCLYRFFHCLANSLEYLHSQSIKHMDIKPKNLLVRDMHKSTVSYDLRYKIYLADFGISRSYISAADCETDTPTSFTRKYSAPEVVLQEPRGLSADVFSLGCVYTEMVAALLCQTDVLEAIIAKNEDGDSSYQANIGRIRTWLRDSMIKGMAVPPSPMDLCSYIFNMLDPEPRMRPTSRFVKYNLSRLGLETHMCCYTGPDPYEAAFPLGDSLDSNGGTSEHL